MNDGPAETTAVLDLLIERGIVAESDADGTLSLADSFLRNRDRHRDELSELDDSTIRDRVESYLAESPLDPEIVDSTHLADARALADGGVELDPAQQLGVSLLLGRIGDSIPAGGAPSGFTPIRGTDIDLFITLSPASVIYCWREDCDPCDVIRADFGSMLEANAIPNAVGLGAVYGPDCPALLSEQYDVEVAPTVLFCVGGRVDSRLVGAHEIEVVRNEIETISELAAIKSSQ